MTKGRDERLYVTNRAFLQSKVYAITDQTLCELHKTVRANSHTVPGTNSSLKSDTAVSDFCPGSLSAGCSASCWKLWSGTALCSALCHWTSTSFVVKKQLTKGKWGKKTHLDFIKLHYFYSSCRVGFKNRDALFSTAGGKKKGA